jgi:hypothetical protein
MRDDFHFSDDPGPTTGFTKFGAEDPQPLPGTPSTNGATPLDALVRQVGAAQPTPARPIFLPQIGDRRDRGGL